MKCVSLLDAVGKDDAEFIAELSERILSLDTYFRPGLDNFQKNIV